MKRVSLPHENNLQGLQFSQADNRALMQLLVGVTVDAITDADRTFAKLLILRYGYFLAELEREQKPPEPQRRASSKPRPDQRPGPFVHRRKKKGGNR